MSVIGDIAGAIIGGHAAKKASQAQTKLGEQALNLEQQQYNQTREDFAPWRQAGGQAISQGYAMLQPGYDYTASPSYQFQLQQGNNAIQNSAAAKGQLMSGGTLKDIAKYTQGLASSDFNDSFNRMMAVAAGGQQANNTVAQAGSNYANQGAGILQGIGNAKASGYMGQANAYINGINNVGTDLQSFASMFGGGGF